MDFANIRYVMVSSWPSQDQRTFTAANITCLRD
jgi:hypothetical protein